MRAWLFVFVFKLVFSFSLPLQSTKDTQKATTAKLNPRSNTTSPLLLHYPYFNRDATSPLLLSVLLKNTATTSHVWLISFGWLQRSMVAPQQPSLSYILSLLLKPYFPLRSSFLVDTRISSKSSSTSATAGWGNSSARAVMGPGWVLLPLASQEREEHDRLSMSGLDVLIV